MASWKEIEKHIKRMLDMVSVNGRNIIQHELIKDQGFLAAVSWVVYKEAVTKVISLSRAPEETTAIKNRILENNTFINEVSRRVGSTNISLQDQALASETFISKVAEHVASVSTSTSLEDQALASETFINEVAERIRSASMRVIKHTSFTDER